MFSSMKKLNSFVLALLVMGISVLSSCDEGDEPDQAPEYIVPGPVVAVNAYPLEVGNEWVYSMRTVITGAITSDDSYMIEHSVELDTTIEGVAVKKVRATETEGTVVGNDRLGFRYFAHTNFGLEMPAHLGSSTQVFFKDEALNGTDNLSFISGAMMPTDEIVVRDSALRYMRLPAVDGDSWISNEYGTSETGAGFRRKWAGYYTVTTDAGTFDCIKLELFDDWDNDSLPRVEGGIFLEQYISPEYGLIKEVHTADLIMNGEPSAYMVRETNLVSKNF